MIPGIINSPETMSKIRVITLKEYSEKTLKVLQIMGTLHIEDSKELKPVDKAAIESERKEVNELLAFVKYILSYVPQNEKATFKDDVEVIYTQPFREIKGEVKSLYNKVNRIYDRTVSLKNEVQELTEKRKYLASLSNEINPRLADLSFAGEYLFSRVFAIPSQAYDIIQERLKNISLEAITARTENDAVLYVIAKTGDQKAIEFMIGDAGGKSIQIPGEDMTLSEYIEVADKKISRLEEEKGKMEVELQDKAKEDLERLLLLREALVAESERLLVLEKATGSKYVTLIEGWIPTADADETITKLRTDIEYVFIDTRKPEAGELPPSKLKNKGILKPFELIVQIFDVPKYGSWDPTPIVAYSFAFFFGIMMNDAIYGLALIAVAKFLLAKTVDDPSSEGFKMFKRLIYISCTVAIVFGIISGNYMGNIYTLFGLKSAALVPGISKMINDPLTFIVITIIIGLIHVDLGHILGLVKAIQDKQKWIVLSKIGLFLLEIGGIPVALRALLRVSLPFIPEVAYPILSYVMYAGLLVIIFTSIKLNGAVGAFFWLFDITGFFGDAVSYCRLAGVSLAGGYLAQSFNMIIGLLGSVFPGVAGAIIGTIVGLLLFIVGHVLNTLLNGMGCFVHSLRLCFVEFLTKFYDGGGREYSPFKLKKKEVISLKS